MTIEDTLNSIAEDLERIAIALEQLSDKADTYLSRTDPTWNVKPEG